MKTKHEIHMEDWLAAISELYAAPPPPPGWFTVRQLAEANKYSFHHMRRVLRRMIDEGKVEKKRFRVKDNSGVYHPFPHYRLITAKSSKN